MNVQSMNYNVGHILYGYAGPTGNVDAGSSAVDGLERVHHQLFLQLDHHVTFENDPQWLILDHTISEGAWFRVHRVIPCVCDHINFAISASNGMLSKSNCAIG